MSPVNRSGSYQIGHQTWTGSKPVEGPRWTRDKESLNLVMSAT